MKFTRSITAILALSLALCGIAKADPFVVIASLLLAKKVTDNRTDKQFENTTRWRDLLSFEEENALRKIQSHPAIHTCLQKSQQGNPIAEYHLRKIAAFSILLKDQLQVHHHGDVLNKVSYQRAAKGFDWCMKQAGMRVGDHDTTLKQHAERLASLLVNPNGGVMLALKDNIAVE